MEYRIAGASGAYATLADDTVGDILSTYKGSFSEKDQISAGFGAPSQGVSPNGNTLVSLEFPLTKFYASYADAKAGVRALRALKGKRLNIKCTEGGDVDFWPSATLKHMTFNLTGKAVDYVLSFDSQDVTAAEPS